MNARPPEGLSSQFTKYYYILVISFETIFLEVNVGDMHFLNVRVNEILICIWITILFSCQLIPYLEESEKERLMIQKHFMKILRTFENSIKVYESFKTFCKILSNLIKVFENIVRLYKMCRQFLQNL